MRDLRVALLDLKEESDSGALRPLRAQKRAEGKRWPLVAAVVAFMALVGSATLWRMSRR
jgi:hypothetical protein